MRTEYVKVAPPAGMLQSCERARVSFRTNRELVVALSEVMEAFERCAARMEAIIGYYKEEE